MEQVLLKIAPLFLIIIVGIVARLTKLADESWVDVLNRYGLYIAFPAIILHSLLQGDLTQQLDLRVLLLNFLLLLLLIGAALLARRLFRLRTPLANTYIICIFFGNIGYLGYPVISSLLPGSEGLISLHISVYNIVLFTVGIYILEHSLGHASCKKTIIRKTLSNPLLLSVIIGLTLMFLQVKLPYVIAHTIDLLHRSASPVVLFALGVFLIRKIDWRSHLQHVLQLTLLQLFLVPLLFYLTGHLSGLDKGFQVSVLEAAMPLAITPFALAAHYPMEREVIVATILFSTALSPVTIALFRHLVV